MCSFIGCRMCIDVYCACVCNTAQGHRIHAHHLAHHTSPYAIPHPHRSSSQPPCSSSALKTLGVQSRCSMPFSSFNQMLWRCQNDSSWCRSFSIRYTFAPTKEERYIGSTNPLAHWCLCKTVYIHIPPNTHIHTRSHNIHTHSHNIQNSSKKPKLLAYTHNNPKLLAYTHNKNKK